MKDEDAKQTFSFVILSSTPQDIAAIDASSGILTRKSADKISAASVALTIKATDNGSPALSMTKQFNLTVVGASSAKVHIFSEGGPVSFIKDRPAVSEGAPVGSLVGTLEVTVSGDKEPEVANTTLLSFVKSEASLLLLLRGWGLFAKWGLGLEHRFAESLAAGSTSKPH